jgi:hypothetical protein
MKLKPTELTGKDIKFWLAGGSEAQKLVPEGYFGNPAGFDLNRGKLIVENYAKQLTELLSKHLNGS